MTRDWRSPRTRPLVLGHRGASGEAPENTMRAFVLAEEQGADGLELDVFRCRSGEVVVFHDDDLARLTGQAGAARRLDWDVLKRLRVQGEPLPLLSEVLARFAGRMLLNIELKSAPSMGELLVDDGLAKSVGALLEKDAAETVLVSSFDPLLLRRFQRARPDVPVGLLFAHDQSLPLRNAWAARWLAPWALHPEACMVGAAAMAGWRRDGRRVHVWTVDDVAELRGLAALGVDAVITNYPGRTRSLFDNDARATS